MSYALCNDRRTLLWFANQRAVEYHPALVRADRPDRVTYLVLDLDPPDADGFTMAVRVAHVVRHALARCRARRCGQDEWGQGCARVRPDRRARPTTRPPPLGPSRREPSALEPGIATTAFMKEDRGGKVFVDPTRVGGATVIAAYSPRVRPGVPVSFPVSWDELDDVAPADFTVHTARQHLGPDDLWAAQMRHPQPLSPDLIEEGRAIPVARVQAMHEGKRRARTRPS